MKKKKKSISGKNFYWTNALLPHTNTSQITPSIAPHSSYPATTKEHITYTFSAELNTMPLLSSVICYSVHACSQYVANGWVHLALVIAN